MLDAEVWRRIAETDSHPAFIAAKLHDLQTYDPRVNRLTLNDRQFADLEPRQLDGTRALLDLDAQPTSLVRERLDTPAERRRRLEEERTAVTSCRQTWEEAQSRLKDMQASRVVGAYRMVRADYARKR